MALKPDRPRLNSQLLLLEVIKLGDLGEARVLSQSLEVSRSMSYKPSQEWVRSWHPETIPPVQAHLSCTVPLPTHSPCPPSTFSSGLMGTLNLNLPSNPTGFLQHSLSRLDKCLADHKFARPLGSVHSKRTSSASSLSSLSSWPCFPFHVRQSEDSCPQHTCSPPASSPSLGQRTMSVGVGTSSDTHSTVVVPVVTQSRHSFISNSVHNCWLRERIKSRPSSNWCDYCL
jgi:hypothetical protein